MGDSLSFSLSLEVLIFLSHSFIADLDETRLTNPRSSECYQHSTPLATGNLVPTQFSSSSPFHLNSRLHHRRQTSTGQMTSYSALKRKAQRAEIASSTSRVRSSCSTDKRHHRKSSSSKSISNMCSDLHPAPMHMSVKIDRRLPTPLGKQKERMLEGNNALMSLVRRWFSMIYTLTSKISSSTLHARRSLPWHCHPMDDI